MKTGLDRTLWDFRYSWDISTSVELPLGLPNLFTYGDSRTTCYCTIMSELVTNSDKTAPKTDRVTRSHSPAVNMEPTSKLPTIMDLYKLLQGSIAENKTNHSSLESQVKGIETKISKIQMDIKTNTSNISANTTSISSHSTQLKKALEEHQSLQAKRNQEIHLELSTAKKESGEMKDKLDKMNKEKSEEI